MMEVAAGGTKHADVNGIRLAYEEFGAGAPLILLHGGYGTYWAAACATPTGIGRG